jgi:hypothetical protein
MTDTKKFAVKFKEFIAENSWNILLGLGFFLIGFTLIESISRHKNEVRDISTQNVGCIYLESSKLGESQHYMVCDGQIFLKRLDEVENARTTEERIQEVVPVFSNKTTPTTK